MNEHLGEIAALLTSVSWTVTALSFEYAAKRIGSLALNVLRLAVALGLFALVGLLLRGQALPLGASGEAWLWLSLSGLVGFVFGDIFLFQAYIDIGARMTQVVFVSSPLITAVIGYFVLGERIAPVGAAGMVLVVAAIAWVVFGGGPSDGESAENEGPGLEVARRARRGRGVFFAFLGALGQSGGLILSKIGAPSFDPFAATQIRVIAGLAGFIVMAAFARRLREPVAACKNIPALKALGVGAFFGPFIGVTLGLYAVQRTSSGIAATLMGLTPILIVIPSVLIRKERIRTREVAGAAVAVFGSTLIFFR